MHILQQIEAQLSQTNGEPKLAEQSDPKSANILDSPEGNTPLCLPDIENDLIAMNALNASILNCHALEQMLREITEMLGPKLESNQSSP